MQALGIRRKKVYYEGYRKSEGNNENFCTLEKKVDREEINRKKKNIDKRREQKV